jgi:tetrahydromethanopterin S-methyltransferase subunit G
MEKSIEKRFDKLETLIQKGHKTSEKRFDLLGKKIDTEVGNLAQITADGFNEVWKKFEQVDDRFEQVDWKLENIDKRLRTIEYIVVEEHHKKFKQMEKDVQKLKSKIV